MSNKYKGYYLRSESNKRLTKSFTAGDFFCKCGKCDKQYIDLGHVKKLQKFQDWLGECFIITSGYRCPDYNKQIGSKSDSQHVKGTATDIFPLELKPRDVAALARSYGFKGVGEYKTFIHVDSREGKTSRWRRKG